MDKKTKKPKAKRAAPAGNKGKAPRVKAERLPAAAAARGRPVQFGAAKLIKMTPADLAAWTDCAKRSSLGVNAWIRDILNAAVSGIKKLDEMRAAPAGNKGKPPRKVRGGTV